jgi:hypothetical protein
MANFAGNGVEMRKRPNGTDVDVYNINNQPTNTNMKTPPPFSPYDQDVQVLPSPFNFIVDANMDRKGLIYEVVLGRELGFEVIGEYSESNGDWSGEAIVGKIVPNSRASLVGIQEGDRIVATSQASDAQTYSPGSTAFLWSHESADGVRAALALRFQSSDVDHVTIRLERSMSRIDPETVAKVKIPYYYTVNLKRPIGLEVVEGPDKKVYVNAIQESFGAERSRKVWVGDQIVSMKTFWGNGMREVDSLETFLTGVKMSTAPQLTFGFKREIALESFMDTYHSKGMVRFKNRLPTPWSDQISISGAISSTL